MFEKQKNEILYAFTKTFAVVNKDLNKKKILKNIIINSSNNNENIYIITFIRIIKNNKKLSRERKRPKE